MKKDWLIQLPTAWLASAKKARRWLDECPWPWMLGVGIGLGMGLGAMALMGIGGWLGQGLCLLALVLAVAVGRNAQPILVGAPVPPQAKPKTEKPKPTPQPAWLPHKPRLVVDIPGLLEMIELPGGTFPMGSPDSDDLAYDNEKPQHLVTVSAFAMGRFAVTRKLYREILNTAPSAWQGAKDDDQLPANYISWFDAIAFCNALSERQALQPCYRRVGDQVEWHRAANGYRLPTEAEWEYAVRAGTKTRWFCGDEPTELGRYAWFSDNAGNRIHPVGEKDPNPWGFHDLSGNVWEWCWDWYGEYSAGPADNPDGPAKGLLRVLRGGACWRGAGALRSAARSRLVPEFWDVNRGFRCVRGPRRPF
jgi:formylglycine-generating enzyme required for sulfatase activity